MAVIKYGQIGKYGAGYKYGQLAGATFLNAVASMSYRGNLYFAWGRFAGGRTLPVTVTFPLQGAGYKIIIYDTLGVKLEEISSETQESPLLSFEFELLTSGCGTFKFKLSQDLNVALTYNYRVDVHLFGDDDPWYSGYIIKMPQAGTTEIVQEYSGYGFYNQLDDVMVNRTYTSKQISWIVRDLISTLIEPQTDIVYDVAKIAPTSYVVQDIKWDRVSAKEVFKQLAELALGYEWGVDEERDFFFRQKETTIADVARMWAGKHLTKFVPEANVEKIKNKIHIYSGQVEVGNETGYVLTVEDATSQAAYGVKESKETLPSVLSDDDAEQWGNYKLSELKDPVQSAKIEGIEVFQTKIEARGKAKITSADGLNSYELPIEKVKYKISSKGIVVDVELGEKDVFLSKATLALLAKQKMLEQLGDQRIQQ
jgi:hypothetical protein